MYRFHITSRYVNVNDQLLLSAVCCRMDGRTWSPATVHLDTVLGNEDGAFVWGGTGLGAEAKDVRLIDHHILSARLKRADGSWTEKPVTVDLAMKIENLDGTKLGD